MDHHKINYRIFILLFFFLSTLFVLDKFGYITAFKGRINDLFIPLQAVIFQEQKRIRDNFNIFSSCQKNQEMRIFLEKIKEDYLVLKMEVDSLEKENKFLREQKGVFPKRKINMVLAKVIGSKDYLVIDKGSNQKVTVQSPVVYKNFLVGIVESVSSNSSKIRLLTSSDFKTEVMVRDTKIKGIARGQYGKNLYITEVLLSEKLNIGEEIITSGLFEKIPADLLIGKIKNIEKNDADFYQKASIELYIDYQKLDYVFILQ